jgi:hypothetical protein
MNLKGAPGVCLVVLATSLHAQDSLVGMYVGAFNLQTQSRCVIPIPMTLVIASAKEGKLEGTVTRSHNNKAGAGCMGEYKLEGTYQGGKIQMKSEPGGAAKDCVMELQLVADGRKLKGTMGSSVVELSK